MRPNKPRSHSLRAGAFTLFASIGLLLTVAACTWQDLQPAAEKARHLYIVGELVHVADQQVAEAAQPYLGAGFFEVDIEAIQTQVSELPWVAAVSVHRRWPDAVVVRVREHRAVALWGEDALLSEDGVVFKPDQQELPANMVNLHGPENSGEKLLDQLFALQAALDASSYRITGLQLDARGSWEAALNNGLALRLGRSDTQNRLQRFVTNLSPELNNRLEDAAYVDLRYADGFAVGPNRGADEPNQKNSG